MIKYGSSSHHILLMLQSAKQAPKTVPTLCFISSKPKWKVERALDVLQRHGLVKPESRSTYWITDRGVEVLRDLSKQGRTMKEDDNMVALYERTNILQAARKRVAQ
jgi:DNA-binding IclR family transcriptional regulator